jgi:hypothetical protein
VKGAGDQTTTPSICAAAVAVMGASLAAWDDGQLLAACGREGVAAADTTA